MCHLFSISLGLSGHSLLRTQNGPDLITEIARYSYDVLITSTGRKQKQLNRRMLNRNEKIGITDGTEIQEICCYSYAVSGERDLILRHL